MGAGVLLVGHALVVVAVVVVVVVVVRVAACPFDGARRRGTNALAQNDDADAHHEQRGDEVHPRIQVLGDDELGEGERDESEREDADRVRDRDDAAERESVARTSRGSRRGRRRRSTCRVRA